MSGGAGPVNYTGGGTLQSSICIEVDEFKFYSIVKNVLYKQEFYEETGLETEEDDE